MSEFMGSLVASLIQVPWPPAVDARFTVLGGSHRFAELCPFRFEGIGIALFIWGMHGPWAYRLTSAKCPVALPHRAYYSTPYYNPIFRTVSRRGASQPRAFSLVQATTVPGSMVWKQSLPSEAPCRAGAKTSRTLPIQGNECPTVEKPQGPIDKQLLRVQASAAAGSMNYTKNQAQSPNTSIQQRTIRMASAQYGPMRHQGCKLKNVRGWVGAPLSRTGWSGHLHVLAHAAVSWHSRCNISEVPFVKALHVCAFLALVDRHSAH